MGCSDTFGENSKNRLKHADGKSAHLRDPLTRSNPMFSL